MTENSWDDREMQKLENLKTRVPFRQNSMFENAFTDEQPEDRR